jgi:hypothetical protein
MLGEIAAFYDITIRKDELSPIVAWPFPGWLFFAIFASPLS